MLTIAIDDLLPRSIIRDLKAARSLVPPSSSPRLYRVPVEVFMKAIEEIHRRNPWLMFRPTVLGLPADMTEKFCPEMVIVHDDDTNAAQGPRSEHEVS